MKVNLFKRSENLKEFPESLAYFSYLLNDSKLKDTKLFS